MREKLANRRRRIYAMGDGGSPTHGMMPEWERWPESLPEKDWFSEDICGRGRMKEEESWLGFCSCLGVRDEINFDLNE